MGAQVIALHPVAIVAADYVEQEYRLTKSELAKAAKKISKEIAAAETIEFTGTSGPPSLLRVQLTKRFLSLVRKLEPVEIEAVNGALRALPGHWGNPHTTAAISQTTQMNRRSSLQPRQPIAGAALEVGDGEDKHAIRFIDVEDGVGEGPAEMPTNFGCLGHAAKKPRCSAGICHEGVDRVVVALTEHLTFFPVARQWLQELGVRLGVKDKWLHKPTSLRARAMTSSPGMA